MCTLLFFFCTLSSIFISTIFVLQKCFFPARMLERLALSNILVSMFEANANYIKDIHFNWESFLIDIRDKKRYSQNKQCSLWNVYLISLLLKVFFAYSLGDSFFSSTFLKKIVSWVIAFFSPRLWAVNVGPGLLTPLIFFSSSRFL